MALKKNGFYLLFAKTADALLTIKVWEKPSKE